MLDKNTNCGTQLFFIGEKKMIICACIECWKNAYFLQKLNGLLKVGKYMQKWFSGWNKMQIEKRSAW